MVKIQTFVFSPFMENTIIVWDESTKIAAVVDPGMYEDEEKTTFSNFISDNDLNLKFIINTHCHIDHIFGVKYVQDNFDVEYLAPKEDMELLDMVDVQAGMFALDVDHPEKPEKFIESGSFDLGDTKLEFLFTPGHTKGEYCLFFPDDKICITGDVLFREGIGRTDLWGGDYNTLENSIKNVLYKLPDETVIYPGHGDSSTIGHEKKFNSFIKA